ncbi:MAG TPA: hypothetical protein DIT97_06555, partial [Gimesia maris]|nr:hypothetical protein [Gimesia maris]
AVFVFLSSFCRSEEAGPSSDQNQNGIYTAKDLVMKTMGGRQFWGDVQFFHGWKIQQHVISQHYRLLDPKDQRHASGSLAVCQQRLA